MKREKVIKTLATLSGLCDRMSLKQDGITNVGRDLTKKEQKAINAALPTDGECDAIVRGVDATLVAIGYLLIAPNPVDDPQRFLETILESAAKDLIERTLAEAGIDAEVGGGF